MHWIAPCMSQYNLIDMLVLYSGMQCISNRAGYENKKTRDACFWDFSPIDININYYNEIVKSDRKRHTCNRQSSYAKPFDVK